MTIQQNLFPQDPELADLLDQFKKSLLLDFNCHHIATVQEFDPATQTARATVNYKKTFFDITDVGLVKPRLVDYAPIVEAPVVVLSGGDYAMTMPIKAGDECLVLFNDRDFGNWYAGSSSSAVPTPRLHAYTDAIILVGLRSKPKMIANYNANGIELRNKDGTRKVLIDDDKVVAQFNANTSVTVDSGGVTVKSASNVTLVLDPSGKLTITNASGEFIASLIEMIKTATTATMLGNQPLILNPSFLTIVESFKS